MATRVRLLCVLVLQLAAAGTGRAAAPPGKTQPPTRLPADLVKAWKAAGAEVGWLRMQEWSSSYPFFQTHGYVWFVSEKDSQAGDLPAFRFRVWQAGRLADLPVPRTNFGLFLGSSKVTDVGLKEVAQFGNSVRQVKGAKQVTDKGLGVLVQLHDLQALTLANTGVTDKGLEALAGLKSLRWLSLDETGVTDGGLMRLKGLDKLKWLRLWKTKVTDKGVAELKKALPGLIVDRSDGLAPLRQVLDKLLLPVKAQRVDADIPGWVLWLVSALVALLGGWGAADFPRPSAPAGRPPVGGDHSRTSPPPRQEQLGLGPDGRGGVWLRQVFPWEQ
jgi:hypothetical protein